MRIKMKEKVEQIGKGTILTSLFDFFKPYEDFVLWS